LFDKLDAIMQFGAGRPSDFDLCPPNEDLAMMMAYVRTKSKIDNENTRLSKKQMEDQRAFAALRRNSMKGAK
jgi:hypothetical protein